jgi:hypothetical protein
VEDNEAYAVNYEAVAAGIRALPTNTQIPFVAATIDLGLMIPPLNVNNAINLVREQHLHLSRYDVMVLILKNHPSIIAEFIEQTAEHAAKGVFPEGDAQLGWNEREFGQAIELLGLLTINESSSIVKESTTKEASNDQTESG